MLDPTPVTTTSDDAAGWTSFVALGDSFTEGVDDQCADGTYRGWADRVAVALDDNRPGLRYANLAVRGRLLSQIVVEQVPRAVAMRPDLVSFVGGINDLLRPSFDGRALHRRLDRAVADLKASGSDVVLVVGVNPAARSRLIARLRPRVDAYNESVRAMAEQHDCLAVDLSDAIVFHDPRFWSVDRLHLSSLGHERVAGAVLQTLGLGDDAWREPLAQPDHPDWLSARRDDAEWARTHLLPWIGRRAGGRSSGTGLGAKRPDLVAVTPC